ncbi:uncharacterized protein BJ171DRAFT_490981 [Polychytrium aggregatum]|uniref:uncharacterized protein n=1 Tax=Polychytrium aggregatum TaxID=110093 RepID=UPI0022FE9093|nr:uncharacterized protein BJ171DRAFT_490981 [Polychytrium aggregatum]KAI9208338.1 hypothetical protein BJ171DRAFT_490981 [Polychytrium aggregatum]
MESLRQAFETFMEANDAQDTLEAFAALQSIVKELAGKDECELQFADYQSIVAPALNFRRKSLFTLLEAKIRSSRSIFVGRGQKFEFLDSLEESGASVKVPHSHAKTVRILVSGAGPCGLRAAIEAKLLGYDVTVIELRSEFSRHNIVKSWTSTIQDLVTLGLNHFYPKFQTRGEARIEIRMIQLVLLKASLLYGVRVNYNEGVCGLVDPALYQSGGPVQDPAHPLALGSDPPADTSDVPFYAWSLPAAEARVFLKLQRSHSTPITEGDVSADDVPAELQLRPTTAMTGDRSAIQKVNKVDYFETALSQDGAVIRSEQHPDLDYLRSRGPRARLYPFDCLLVAEGESSRLIRHLGFDRRIAKFGEAIGLVVNLNFTEKGLASSQAPERQIAEFVFGRYMAKWRSTILGKLAESGIDVENMEYMRGTRTHFMVTTVKKASLHSAGVLKDIKPTITECLDPSNVDLDRLYGFGRALASAVGVPAECTFASKNGVQIFDFSCKGRCVETVRPIDSALATISVADSSNGAASSQPSRRCIVLPIGDAVQNPFWPQGLGINRGFHTSLDAVYACFHWSYHHDFERVRRERELCWRVMEWLTFAEYTVQTPTNLTATVVWSPDPLTRYNPEIFKSIHKEHPLYLTETIRQALSLN